MRLAADMVTAGIAVVMGTAVAMDMAGLDTATVDVDTLVDADTVDLTNLQRQILHVTASVGRSKVESGRDAIAQLNPDVVVDSVMTADQLSKVSAVNDKLKAIHTQIESILGPPDAPPAP